MAKWLEHGDSSAEVAGSNPAEGTNFLKLKQFLIIMME